MHQTIVQERSHVADFSPRKLFATLFVAPGSHQGDAKGTNLDMHKLTTLTALSAALVLSISVSADAAQRSDGGIEKQAATKYEISDQRRHRRYNRQSYRRDYYRPYSYYGGPAYGYGPGYYRPYGYGSPGVGFNFRF